MTTLLARFVLHVLPRGFHRIRHYGVLGNRHKAAKLAACRRYFGTPPPRSQRNQDHASAAPAFLGPGGLDPTRCPACGSRRLRRELLPPVPPCPRARAPTRIPLRRTHP